MNYFHWQEWLREYRRLGIKCRLWERCSERPEEITDGEAPALTFSLLIILNPPYSISNSCGLNTCTIFIFPVSGIRSCDIHLLPFQLISFATPTPACLWTPVGTKIYWSCFSWSLTPSCSYFLLYQAYILLSIVVYSPLPLSLCHTHLAKPPSYSIQLSPCSPCLSLGSCCGWGQVYSYPNCSSQI